MSVSRVGSQYRCYGFIDKDPAIDQIRTLLQDEKMYHKLSVVSDLSGVSTQTLYQWFMGDTKRPQNATMEAVARSLGFERVFKRFRERGDDDDELKKARAWKRRQKSK